jgi:hypothetical protein
MTKNDLHVFLILVLIPTILAPIHIKDSIAVVLKICRCWSHHRRQYGVVGGGGWHMLDGCAVGKEGASSSAVIRKEKQAKEGEVYNRRKSDQRKDMVGKWLRWGVWKGRMVGGGKGGGGGEREGSSLWRGRAMRMRRREEIRTRSWPLSLADMIRGTAGCLMA